MKFPIIKIIFLAAVAALQVSAQTNFSVTFYSELKTNLSYKTEHNWLEMDRRWNGLAPSIRPSPATNSWTDHFEVRSNYAGRIVVGNTTNTIQITSDAVCWFKKSVVETVVATTNRTETISQESPPSNSYWFTNVMTATNYIR